MSKLPIIILYASLDDKPERDAPKGWVTSFGKNILELLSRLDNDQYSLLKLTEYDIEPDSYPTEKAVIFPVLSTNFFQSPLLTGYLDVLEREVINKSVRKEDSRFLFISIFKNRVQKDLLPKYIISSKRKYFYSVDSLTDFVSEIQFMNDPVKDHYYWMKVFDLAYVIKNFNNRDDNSLAYLEGLVDQMRPAGVYLAQVGLDLEFERENLFRELIRNNYPIYQMDLIDENFEKITYNINQKLSKCFLSIHLIGEDAGQLIKDRGLAIVEIENQLSSEHGRQVNQHSRTRHKERFKRIIWLSPDRHNLSVKQKMFIENLKKDQANIQNAEILEMPIEELKNFVSNFIDQRLETIDTGSIFDQNKRKSIYFICDKDEFNQCKPLGKVLEERGYDVVFSNFEGELIKVRDLHNRHLQQCDGTLIYYGGNNENWVKSKLFDSVKSLGLGRIKGSNPTAVIVDSDKKIDLDLYQDADKLIIDKSEKAIFEAFEPFLARIEEE